MAVVEQQKFKEIVTEHAKEAGRIFMELLEEIMNEMDFEDGISVNEMREAVIQELEAELSSLSVVLDFGSGTTTVSN